MWGKASFTRKQELLQPPLYTGSQTRFPESGCEPDPDKSALFRRLPHGRRGGRALLAASDHEARRCPSLGTTVIYAKNSFPNLIDWNPCDMVSRAGSDTFQKMIRR